MRNTVAGGELVPRTWAKMQPGCSCLGGNSPGSWLAGEPDRRRSSGMFYSPSFFLADPVGPQILRLERLKCSANLSLP